MDINNIGYNIGEVSISTALTDSTKTEVGTPADFAKVMTLAKSGGVVRLNFKISTTAYSVVVGVNPGSDAISIGGVTDVAGAPVAVTGTLTLESSKMYATIGVTALGGDTPVSRVAKQTVFEESEIKATAKKSVAKAAKSE